MGQEQDQGSPGRTRASVKWCSTHLTVPIKTPKSDLEEDVTARSLNPLADKNLEAAVKFLTVLLGWGNARTQDTLTSAEKAGRRQRAPGY